MDVNEVLKRSKALRKAGDYSASRSLLDEALRDEPNAQLFHSRAMTFDQTGQSEKAVEDLSRALTLDKANPSYLFDRACILAFPLNRHEEAILDFEQVLDIQPDNVEAHRQCCGSLLIMGRADSALQHAKEAFKLAPSEWSTNFYLGETYISLKRYLDAVVFLNKALEIDPSRSEVSSALNRAQKYLRQ